MNLESIQSEIQRTGLDGWLFFDHHERDPLGDYCVLDLATRTFQKLGENAAKVAAQK